MQSAPIDTQFPNQPAKVHERAGGGGGVGLNHAGNDRLVNRSEVE